MTLAAITLPIVLAVLKVAAVAATGWVLARRGVLHATALADLSTLVITVSVPCLIFSNAAGGFAGMSGAGAGLAVTGAPLVIGLGAAFGFGLCRLFRIEREHMRPVMCAATFGNSAYLPIAVTTAVLPPLAVLLPPGATTTPAAVAGTGIVMISLFGVLYSPLFWGIGLSWLTQTAGGKQSWRSRLLPPPVWGVLFGFGIGLTPPLHRLFAPTHAPLHFALAAATDIGGTAVPLANLILGAMLAGVGGGKFIRGRDALAVTLGKLVLLPGVTLSVLWLLRTWWTGDGTLCVAAFALLLQAAMPSATNLAVVSKSRGSDNVAQIVPGLLLACYAVAVITVPLWLLLFFRLLATRH